MAHDLKMPTAPRAPWLAMMDGHLFDMPDPGIMISATHCENVTCEDRCRSVSIVISLGAEGSVAMRFKIDVAEEIVSDMVAVIARQKADAAKQPAPKKRATWRL